MAKVFVAAIIVIVVVSVLSVVTLNSFSGAYSISSGAYAASYGYGASKIYGPGIKNSYKNAAAYGKENLYYDIKAAQDFMYANPDKWVCKFDQPKGYESDDPCIFDEESMKWCCIWTDQTFLTAQRNV